MLYAPWPIRSLPPSSTRRRLHDHAFFGHPRGLSTLFFTEMWERFSYYGMRALLILFMTAPVATGGLGFDTAVAGAVYGLYTSMVYMSTLPGGWIADRVIGQRRAVLYGGIFIASGHFSMAFPSLATFYLGLFLIVIGTGLLKGNVSVIVGQLYGPRDARRDAGFSIFYMGINLGAFIAPLICGYLGQRVNWHAGFASAGFGMVIGIVQYILGGKYLGDAGVRPADRQLAGRGCRRPPPEHRLGAAHPCGRGDRRRRRIHRSPADHRHADRRRRGLHAADRLRGVLRLAVPRAATGRLKSASGSTSSARSSSPRRCSGRSSSRPAPRSTSSPIAIRGRRCSAGRIRAAGSSR